MSLFTVQQDLYSPSVRKRLTHQAKRCFDRINHRRFLPILEEKVPEVPLIFSPRMTRYGGKLIVREAQCIIKLSLPLLHAKGWRVMTQVLKHEMCHLWVFEKSPDIWCLHGGHNETFQYVANLVGAHVEENMECKDLYMARHRVSA